jgi:hypothetical protein
LDRGGLASSSCQRQVASRLQPQTAHTGEHETVTSYHQWVPVLLGKTRHTPTDRFV